MREREELTEPRARVRRRATRPVGALAALGLSALIAAGCGGDDERTPSKDRPPLPIELTARVDAESIEVSPSKVGGGLINLTISNQTDSGIRITLEPPKGSKAKSVSSNEIPANAVDNLKANVDEGTYVVSAEGADAVDSDRLVVGPDRPASTNELLAP